MKIEVAHSQLRELQSAIRQFKIRHGPFYKLVNSYRIYLYPSSKLSLFLIKMSGTDLKVLDDAGIAQG
jgi:hypothetical protein